MARQFFMLVSPVSDFVIGFVVGLYASKLFLVNIRTDRQTTRTVLLDALERYERAWYNNSVKFCGYVLLTFRSRKCVPSEITDRMSSLRCVISVFALLTHIKASRLIGCCWHADWYTVCVPCCFLRALSQMAGRRWTFSPLGRAQRIEHTRTPRHDFLSICTLWLFVLRIAQPDAWRLASSLDAG